MEPGPCGKDTNVENFPCQLSKHFNRNIESPSLDAATHAIFCPSSSTSSLIAARDRDERYIQYSKVPTLHFQPSLPRLPIPKLADTCRRYLAALQPLVPPEQYHQTKTIVEDFMREGGEGEGTGLPLLSPLGVAKLLPGLHIVFVRLSPFLDLVE